MANSLGEIRQTFFTKLCTPDGAREKATRLCQTAGRRSAGVGSNGGTRTQSHAVGVRARVGIPQATRIRAEDVPGGNLRRWRIICAGGTHW